MVRKGRLSGLVLVERSFFLGSVVSAFLLLDGSMVVMSGELFGCFGYME